MRYYINIGSNLGNREANLHAAVSAVEAAFGVCKVSSVVKSAPWGYESPNDFLNVGVAFDSDALPAAVLVRLQSIEQAMGASRHRDDNGAYIDRLVDIDIVAVDEMVIDTATLKVPHPHLPERDFFLKPMCQLAPQWRHPQLGETPREMMEALLVKS
jgi:2-amino-4-hydroxy-6-hydroxymethyldihydropteridine diphosphokinase